MTRGTMTKALEEAKGAIGRLIAGIEQHHATSTCYDSGIWALANREYKTLDTLRDAITEAKACELEVVVARDDEAGYETHDHDLPFPECYGLKGS